MGPAPPPRTRPRGFAQAPDKPRETGLSSIFAQQLNVPSAWHFYYHTTAQPIAKQWHGRVDLKTKARSRKLASAKIKIKNKTPGNEIFDQTPLLHFLTYGIKTDPPKDIDYSIEGRKEFTIII